MGTYHRLLEIEVQHGYYAGACCPGLHFTPTAASRARVQHAAAVMRTTTAGLLLLADGEEIESWLAKDDNAGSALSWWLHIEDPAFCNTTAGLGRPRQELMVFDAAHAVPDETGDCARLDHELVRCSALDASEALELAQLPRTARGLVRIPYQALRDAWTHHRTAHYLIRFTPRATLWAYWLVGEWTEPALQIVDLARRVDFEPMPSGRLADGRTALVFRSTRPIALQQQPSECFQLRSRNEENPASEPARASRVLIKRLPVAAPRHFAREVIGAADTLVSEIFVHR